MVSSIHKTIEEARTKRIAEATAARDDPSFNLLSLYADHLDFMQALLGDPTHTETGRRSRKHEPLVRLAELAPVAQAVRAALGAILAGQVGSKALTESTEYCLSQLESESRSSYGSGSRDVAELAVRDAVLAGVVMFLHDRAVSRKTRPSSSSGKSANQSSKRKGVE